VIVFIIVDLSLGDINLLKKTEVCGDMDAAEKGRASCCRRGSAG
jgi:hypothetical protein